MSEVSGFSEDESDEIVINTGPPPEMQSVLCKWTNYIHGWQDRYFVLRDGIMSYYRSEGDATFGCRGSISISRAVVKPHEIDECRFDVNLNDCVWYLRTNTPEEKHKWVDAIELHKERESLDRHGSVVSLTTLSVNSAIKTKGAQPRGAHELLSSAGLREKLSELDTYRDILMRQMDALQGFFDACSELTRTPSCNGDAEEDPPLEDCLSQPLTLTQEMLEKHGAQAINFRGEALTFKATTAGILTTLSHCVEVVAQREDCYRRRLEKEGEKRKLLQERLRELACRLEEAEGDQRGEGDTPKVVVVGGPDYEEGPHSVMGEDEFFDAVESTLEKMDEEEQFRERLRQRRNVRTKPSSQHPIWAEINKITEEQLQYATGSVEDGGWLLFAEDGDMKLYRREVEVEGIVMDPCKALHQVPRVTAHEMAHHFWSPDVRFEWDITIEQMTVLDNIDDNTLVFLQVHKRVWPITQRDCLFWSHLRRIEDPLIASQDPKPYDTWIVSNHSTEHPEAPVPEDGKRIRLQITVCFVCQTFIEPPLAEGETLASISRDRLLTKIIYCSNVNPGGWAPASVLRTVFKREYPRFVKRFSQYVTDKCADQPPAFDGLKILNHNKIWRGVHTCWVAFQCMVCDQWCHRRCARISSSADYQHLAL